LERRASRSETTLAAAHPQRSDGGFKARATTLDSPHVTVESVLPPDFARTVTNPISARYPPTERRRRRHLRRRLRGAAIVLGRSTSRPSSGTERREPPPGSRSPDSGPPLGEDRS